MVNYQNGKIYKLVNSVNDKIYVGSTSHLLHKRFYDHKHASSRQPQYRVYSELNEIGWENVEIILIELCPCNSKMELEKREREIIDELKPELNKNLPARDLKKYQKEYRDSHKDIAKEYKKEYYQNNKEQISKKHREYNQNNKEKLRNYNREYQRKYRLKKKKQQIL